MITVFTQENNKGILEGALQVNPQIFENVELLTDRDLNRNVRSVPLNAAIAYAVTVVLYDKVISRLFVEFYMNKT